MKFNKITILAAVLVFLILSHVSLAQMNKVTALLRGDAVSSSGGPATDVSVTIYKGTDVANKTKLTPEGKFTAILQPGTQYRVTFGGGKYYFHEEQLSVPASDQFQNVPMHVTLKELELGRPYNFTNLIFEPNSSIISAAATTEMESIAAAMKHNQKLTITATVYPDQMPSGKNAAAQNALAASRKSAILAFFISKNIPSTNISVTISTNVSSSGTFERVIMQDATPVKGKKKKGKKAAATAAAAGKKVMVPQDAEIVMQMPS